jgi:hypothetical protein
MASQILMINLSSAASARELDDLIATGDGFEWTQRLAGLEGLYVDRETIVAFFAGQRDDEDADDTPTRLSGPADSWMFLRLALARATNIRIDEGSVYLTLSDVAEEDQAALRHDALDVIWSLIGGYEMVENLGEIDLRATLESAARSGAAVFPGLPPSASDEPRHMKPPAGNVRKDLPSRYLFSRRDFPELRTLSPSELAYQVFFQMWQNKQAPYSQIEEGDVVYLGDTETRRIYWEVRVAALLHDGYASTADALDALWRSYGLAEDDLNDYHLSRPPEGFVLAWAPIVMQRLDISLPSGQNFGRNGYRSLTDEDLDAIALPPLATGSPLAEPPDTYDPQNWRVRPHSAVSRYIPLHVRQAVTERDRGTCVGGCGATTGLHFDHIVPYSRGGQPTVENVRLLCAVSNLSKGSRGPDAPLVCSPR